MKALVLSDTHGNTPLAFRAHGLAEPVDIIFHLGDGSADADLLREVLDVPVINVAGNCDIGSSAPRELVWTGEGKRILLTHGDAYQVKSGLMKLERRGREAGADAVLFGHSHLATNELRSDFLLVNPGTLSVAANRKTFAIMDISSDRITASHFDID